MKRAWWLVLGLIALTAPWRGSAAGGLPLPVLFQSAPGQFEIAAVDVGGAQRIVALAAEAWQFLAVPLALPESFSSPVFVRLVPVVDWRETVPFRVFVETGGVVSVRVRWDESTSDIFLRRALVQGLIMRQAVARHGINERLAAPLWLEHACVGWWKTRAEPAQLDGLRQRTMRRAAPDLASLLNWRRGESEPLELSEGSVWLLSFLRSESPRAQEWLVFLQRILGGEPPEAALLAAYPDRFQNVRERELWWLTGWHHLSRVRTLPGMEAAESRVEIAELMRFVFRRGDSDVVVSLRELLPRRAEALVDAEFKVRIAALNRILPALHPFYRNVALSLVELLTARDPAPGRSETLWKAFEVDWRDAQELEAGSAAALDALERSVPPPRDRSP